MTAGSRFRIGRKGAACWRTVATQCPETLVGYGRAATDIDPPIRRWCAANNGRQDRGRTTRPQSRACTRADSLFE